MYGHESSPLLPSGSNDHVKITHAGKKPSRSGYHLGLKFNSSTKAHY